MKAASPRAGLGKGGGFQVAAVIVRRGGRVLIARRTAPPALAGGWEFPGGKREAGESILDAARRELKEELGLSIRSPCVLDASIHDDGPRRLTMVFIGATSDGPARSRGDHDRLVWVDPQRLGDYPMVPADLTWLARGGMQKLVRFVDGPRRTVKPERALAERAP